MNGYGFMLLAALSFRRDMVRAVCNDAKNAMESLCSEAVPRRMATPVSEHSLR
jgi:hypothetical protein